MIHYFLGDMKAKKKKQRGNHNYTEISATEYCTPKLQCFQKRLIVKTVEETCKSSVRVTIQYSNFHYHCLQQFGIVAFKWFEMTYFSPLI